MHNPPPLLQSAADFRSVGGRKYFSNPWSWWFAILGGSFQDDSYREMYSALDMAQSTGYRPRQSYKAEKHFPCVREKTVRRIMHGMNIKYKQHKVVYQLYGANGVRSMFWDRATGSDVLPKIRENKGEFFEAAGDGWLIKKFENPNHQDVIRREALLNRFHPTQFLQPFPGVSLIDKKEASVESMSDDERFVMLKNFYHTKGIRALFHMGYEYDDNSKHKAICWTPPAELADEAIDYLKSPPWITCDDRIGHLPTLYPEFYGYEDAAQLWIGSQQDFDKKMKADFDKLKFLYRLSLDFGHITQQIEALNILSPPWIQESNELIETQGNKLNALLRDEDEYAKLAPGAAIIIRDLLSRFDVFQNLDSDSSVLLNSFFRQTEHALSLLDPELLRQDAHHQVHRKKVEKVQRGEVEKNALGVPIMVLHGNKEVKQKEEEQAQQKKLKEDQIKLASGEFHPSFATLEHLLKPEWVSSVIENTVKSILSKLQSLSDWYVREDAEKMEDAEDQELINVRLFSEHLRGALDDLKQDLAANLPGLRRQLVELLRAQYHKRVSPEIRKLEKVIQTELTSSSEPMLQTLPPGFPIYYTKIDDWSEKPRLFRAQSNRHGYVHCHLDGITRPLFTGPFDLIHQFFSHFKLNEMPENSKNYDDSPLMACPHLQEAELLPELGVPEDRVPSFIQGNARDQTFETFLEMYDTLLTKISGEEECRGRQPANPFIYLSQSMLSWPKDIPLEMSCSRPPSILPLVNDDDRLPSDGMLKKVIHS